MTTTVDLQIVPYEPPSLPELRAADEGMASSLELVLSGNTRRIYTTHPRVLEGWCHEVGLASLPAEPLLRPATWSPGRTPAHPWPP